MFAASSTRHLTCTGSLPPYTSSAFSQSRLKSWVLIILIRKLKLPSVSDIIRNKAISSSPRVSSASSLKEIRLNPEPCLAGTGTTDNQHILISCIGGILWPVAHHRPLCFSEKHIVFKNRIHEWHNVIRAAP